MLLKRLGLRRKKIGLALGGGGACGLAHIGVLKVLKEAGIKVDMIAGASMGALIGAMYVLGSSVEEIEKEAIGFDKKQAIMKLFDFGGFKNSIIKGEKIYKYIDQLLQSKDFQDTKIPFEIVVTDLESGDEVILNEGKITTAVMASIAVPGVFAPVKIAGRYYIDGGVVNPTPIELVRKMGADIVIGVDLISMRDEGLAGDPNIMTTLLQTYEIIRSQAVKFQLAKSGNAIVIKPKIRASVESFKFYDIVKFIKSGEDAAKEVLPEILRSIK